MSDKDERERDWLDTELDETLEEMFELEFSEPMMSDDIRNSYKKRNPNSLDNTTYFRNLLRLQTELIKLRDSMKDKPATAHYLLTVAAVVFEKGVNLGWIDANPVIGISKIPAWSQ